MEDTSELIDLLKAQNEELKQTNTNMQELLKKYSDELKRQAEERAALQEKQEADQKMLVEQEKALAEQEKLLAEKEAQKEKELHEFRSSIAQSLDKLESKDTSTDILAAIDKNTEKLETLNTGFKKSVEQSSTQFAQTGFAAGYAGVVVVAILVFIFLNWFFKPFFSF